MLNTVIQFIANNWWTWPCILILLFLLWKAKKVIGWILLTGIGILLVFVYFFWPSLLMYGGTLWEAKNSEAQRPAINIQYLETGIHDLINTNRSKYGLLRLVYNYELANIARNHSTDMALSDYFSHTNLKGMGPTERAKIQGFVTKRMLSSNMYIDGIGENIFKCGLFKGGKTYYGTNTIYDWYTQDELIELIVTGWMESPGHRANILNNTYIQEGIGVYVDNPNKELLVTEDFW